MVGTRSTLSDGEQKEIARDRRELQVQDHDPKPSRSPQFSLPLTPAVPSPSDYEFRTRKAEENLLQGNLRKALVVSNQLLEQYLGEESSAAQQNSLSRSSDASCFVDEKTKQTPVVEQRSGIIFLASVNIFRRSFESRVEFCERRAHSKHQCLDRCAAVTLQSWYEISQQAQSHDSQMISAKKKNSEGFNHLYPVLEVYSTIPMSLELKTLFLRFLVKVNAKDSRVAALHISLSLLNYFILRLEDPVEVLAPFNELLQDVLRIVYCELLPGVNDPREVRRLLSAIQLDHRTDLTVFRTESLIGEGPYMESIQVILDEGLPLIQMVDTRRDLDFANEVKISLNSLLAHSKTCPFFYRTFFSLVQSRETVIPKLEEAEKLTKAFSSSCRLLPGQLRIILTRLVDIFQRRVAFPLIKSESRLQNQSQLSMVVFVLWVAWKQRHRLSQAMRRLVSGILVQSVYEVLEAVTG